MPRRKRKPGGQPGNQNARKHGVYSKVLTPEEQRVLSLASIPGIDGEIALLRMKIRAIIKEDRWPAEGLNRTMHAICRAVRLRHNMASQQRRELIALSRLGLLSPEALAKGGILVESSEAGERKRPEPKMPVTKLVVAPPNLHAKQPDWGEYLTKIK
jgi:hypothetical protein